MSSEKMGGLDLTIAKSKAMRRKLMNRYWNTFKRTTMDMDLYRATIKGGVDHFIETFYRVSAAKQLSIPSIFEQTTPLGNSYLHVAAAFGYGSHRLTWFIAISVPSLITSLNSKGDTPLHVASRSGKIAAVRIFTQFPATSPEDLLDLEAAGVKCGAEIRALSDWRPEILLGLQNCEGNTALHLAMMTAAEGDDPMSMRWGVVEHLMGHGEEEVSFVPNDEGKSPFYLAVEYGKKDLVKRMLQICVDKGYYSNCEDVQGKSPVHAAIRGRNKDMLEIILEKLPNLIQLRDEDGETLLHCAASKGYYEGVQYLLDKSSEFVLETDDNGFLPVHTASGKGHLSILQKLLSRCPDWRELLTDEGQNILHVAARNGKSRVVDYILRTPEHGKLLNERDDDGNTPLHLATMQWNPKIVSSLTWDKRIKLDLVNGDGMTALDAAEELMRINVMTSFRQRLTWMALKSAGAPNRKGSKVPKLTTQTSGGYQPPKMENYKERINTLLLVAALVATVTFAAGFTMPGGYNNSDPNQGMATMLNKTKFQIFVICDTIAMFSSMIVAVALIWAQLGDLNLILTSLKLALPMLALALSMMSLAFMAGVCLVVSKLTWLANVVLIMGIVLLSILLVLFFPLFSPNTTTFPVIRHISYYFFCLLMLASGSYCEDEEE